MFVVVDFNKEQDIPEVIAEVESEEEVFDTYLTYLDEEEIIDFIVDNDINVEDSTSSIEVEDYFDYSEDDIEDYYLDELL